MDDPTAGATMIPTLPCLDIDVMAEFWVAIGLQVTYRQLRPNPFLALHRGDVDLHYYGLPGLDPEQNHSTCSIVVADTAPLHGMFVAGLRHRYGKAPLTGLPRITRPRPRPNNAGLSGFSLIDPAGNWIRVSARPKEGREPRAVDDRTEWVGTGDSPVARALENAVVLGDSHGDDQQAERVLSGAVRRNPAVGVADMAAALAYLVELRTRIGDDEGAEAALAALGELDVADLPPADREAVEQARTAAFDARS